MKKDFSKSKKIVFFSFLFLFIFLISTKSFAVGKSGRVFGGTIILNDSTNELNSLEGNGYDCNVPGRAIEIKSIKGPTQYVIPRYVKSKSSRMPNNNKKIAGKYSGKSTINCEKKDSEGNVQRKTLTYDSITLFDVSK